MSWPQQNKAWASYQIRKLRVAHVPGMSGMFSPSPTSTETASKRPRHASRHVRHARAVMHGWIARAVIHGGIVNLQWRGNRSRHSRRMRNPQYYVPGKGPWYSYTFMGYPLLFTASSDYGKCWFNIVIKIDYLDNCPITWYGKINTPCTIFMSIFTPSMTQVLWSPQ